MRLHIAVCLLVSLFVSSAYAQRGGRSLGGDANSLGNVTIRVVYADGRPGPAQLLVQLVSAGSSSPVGTTFTRENGLAGFSGVAIGVYHAIVSGQDIETTDSGSFEVDSRMTAQSQFVYVRQKDNASQAGGGPPLVMASSMGVPKKAQKEFDRSVEAINGRDWNKALAHLSSAIAIYPQYVAAYTNLGVVYGELNDPVRQREALEKAVSLDDHFAPALVDLARVEYHDKRFPESEELLEKATRVDPSNAQTLVLLAQTDLVNQRYDDAILNARKVHNLPHAHLAIIHYIAARALQMENRAKDAVAEFQAFLKEEPDGPRAAQVRSDMAHLQPQKP